MNIEIRKARKQDTPAIKRLIRAYPDQLMQTHLPHSSEFFVALLSDKIIACCALAVYSKRLAEVRSLAVAEAYKGNGVGPKLIEACLKKAREKKIHEVLAITGAVETFEKQGFASFKGEKIALLKVLD